MNTSLSKKLQRSGQSMVDGQPGSVQKVGSFKKLLRLLCHWMIPLAIAN